MVSDYTIAVVDEKNVPAVTDEIVEKLLDSLSNDNKQACNSSTTFEVRNIDKQLIAGLSMSTAYGWVLIKALWVAEDRRRSALGTHLMNRALDKGRELECHGVWLDTSSVAARDFYYRLGFRDFGVLVNTEDDFPPTHRRWFLQYRL